MPQMIPDRLHSFHYWSVRSSEVVVYEVFWWFATACLVVIVVYLFGYVLGSLTCSETSEGREIRISASRLGLAFLTGHRTSRAGTTYAKCVCREKSRPQRLSMKISIKFFLTVRFCASSTAYRIGLVKGLTQRFLGCVLGRFSRDVRRNRGINKSIPLM